MYQYLNFQDPYTENLPKPYSLQLPFQKGWKKAKNRVLVVVEHVASKDLKEGVLLGSPDSKSTYTTLMKQAQSYAKLYGCKKAHKFAFINYNYFKTYHLDRHLVATANQLAAKRIKGFITKVDPTLVVILGDKAAQTLLQDPTVPKYRGQLHELLGIPTVTTLDIDRSFSIQGDKPDAELDDSAVEHANILGYVARNICHGLIGSHPHSVKDVQPAYKLIDTLPKFNRLMGKLYNAQAVSVDTEGTSLDVLQNVLQLVQFSVSAEMSYILPIHHKDSPWTEKELTFIRSSLRHYFNQSKAYKGNATQYHIGQNYGYDQRMLMRWLNIRRWKWHTWDLQAGEYGFDENVKVLQRYGTPSYGLAQIACNYCNDFYYTASFSKKDRVLIADVDLDEPLLRYSAMDTQLPFAIHLEQKKRAKVFGNTDYEKLVLLQISTMIRVMATLRYRGTRIDVDYLASLMEDTSPLTQHIEELTQQFLSTDAVRQADKAIKESSGIPTDSLFSQDNIPVFKLGKRGHMEFLFQEVMELEPLKFSRKTGKPSYDKFFFAEYAEQHEAIAYLQRLAVLTTLKSSFISSFHEKIICSHDGRIDQRLRPDFGYWGVVTGRSNSSNPSLQQIPEHSADAKIVKRMFITPWGSLPYEADYSAHEVRCWGIISDDSVLRTTFKTIHKLITRYRKRPTERNLERKITEGDPHKQNYKMFMGTPLNKIDKVMRQAAKGITFGSVYGMSVKSLAEQIKRTVEETQEIMNKFFAKFSKAKKWLDDTVHDAQTSYFTRSSIGRRRNLFGYISGHKGVKGAMDRRAMNSPIQGMASDFGFIAADLLAEALDVCYRRLKIPHDTYAELPDLPIGANAMVHDSLKGEAPFDLYLLHLHLAEWAMTRGLTAYLIKYYDFDPNVPFDIEFDLGADWSKKSTWSWSEDHLKELLGNLLTDHADLHHKTLDVPSTVNQMYTSYAEQSKVLRLDTRYPRNN